jgi:hypothetical protein
MFKIQLQQKNRSCGKFKNTTTAKDDCPVKNVKKLNLEMKIFTERPN